jgi:hypothetical protein
MIIKLTIQWFPDPAHMPIALVDASSKPQKHHDIGEDGGGPI